MHDIWNPWHGCRKCSEGCRNCYMYFLDHKRGGYGFYYPLATDKNGNYRVKYKTSCIFMR